jgi:anti-sigma B factor antagonist
LPLCEPPGHNAAPRYRSPHIVRGGHLTEGSRGSPAFDVSVEHTGGAVVIGLSGELDLSVEQTVQAALDEAGDGQIVIDLRGLTFMDSTGLRLILRADSRCRERHRPLRLVPGPTPVQRVFELAGVEDRLDWTGEQLA